MAGKKISALPAIPSSALSDIGPFVQGGVTYKASLTQIAALFSAQLTFLPLTGGTLSGALNMGNHQINALASPTLSTDAATKAYVDSVAQGLSPKAPSQAASTGALTVTYANGSSGVGATLTNAGAQAAFAIDGYTASVGDRILIKNQASTFQNGIYTVTNVGSNSTNWVLTRAVDMDAPAEFYLGTTLILNGTVNVNTQWTETTVVVTVGTTAVTFVQTGAAVNYPISLTLGGTNASLTASNGGLVYSTGSALAILAGTATAGQIPRSGANAAPTWSTATYPATAGTSGNVMTSDGTNFVSSAPTTLSQIIITTITSSQTFTRNVNTKSLTLEAMAGGGAGGGASASNSIIGFGGGAGAGGYSRSQVSAATFGASQVVTIGAAGVPGSAGANNGGNGGDTSIGSLCIAKGGTGGNGMSTSSGNTVAGAPGGIAGTGDFTATGANGFNAICSTAIGATGQNGGAGGSTQWGSGGIGPYMAGNGNAATGYGGGGGGGADYLNNTNRSGGPGSAGVAIITEYI